MSSILNHDNYVSIADKKRFTPDIANILGDVYVFMNASKVFAK